MAEGIVLSMILTSHIGWHGKFNDVHPTIAYEYQSYSVGVFRNSLNHTSVFASKTEQFEDFSVQYGAASNYNGRTVPMLVIRKPIDEHFNLIFVPSYDTARHSPAAVVGVEMRF